MGDTDEDQEEDIRLHDDDVAVVERVLKAAEENLDDIRIRTRCMTCLRSVTARTRSWRGMTLNLYLDQREDIYMRVYKIYLIDDMIAVSLPRMTPASSYNKS